jgi:hypothetical protein
MELGRAGLNALELIRSFVGSQGMGRVRSRFPRAEHKLTEFFNRKSEGDSAW